MSFPPSGEIRKAFDLRIRQSFRLRPHLGVKSEVILRKDPRVFVQPQLHQIPVNYGLEIPSYKVGDFDTELCEEFFLGFVRHAAVTLHIKQLAGTNSHHIIEGAFKSAARSLSAAVKIDRERKNEIPSTKGVL